MGPHYIPIIFCSGKQTRQMTTNEMFPARIDVTSKANRGSRTESHGHIREAGAGVGSEDFVGWGLRCVFLLLPLLFTGSSAMVLPS